ncbi:hypothetical protein ACFL6I_16610 [candidate division KSB1 bacterium]
MKTIKKITSKKNFRLAKFFLKSKGFILVSFLATTLILGSCSKGFDGRDGRAFLSVTWDVDVPDFIEVGNPSFPPSFYYGEFYLVNPGYYVMYYEGIFWNGYDWIPYAWDIEYEIIENRGEPGGYSYDGRDGLDNYFTLRCTPYGPYPYQLKSAETDENGEKIIEERENSIIVTKELESFSIKITYSKADTKDIKNQKE